MPYTTLDVKFKNGQHLEKRMYCGLSLEYLEGLLEGASGSTEINEITIKFDTQESQENQES